jgi:hypothetical protein
MYKPIRRTIPSIGPIPNVMGRHSATAMVAESPGIAPNIIPTPTPNTINSIAFTDKIAEKPVKNISNI